MMSKTPLYTKFDQSSIGQKNSSKQQNNKGFNDDFEDLLSDLMSKQQMKKSRRNNLQPYSSQNLGPTGMDMLNKTTDKFNNPNIQSDINFNYGGLSKGGNKDSKKSFLDDLGSQDNKSYKSGATGKRDNQVFESLNFIKNNQPFSNQPSQGNIPSRGGMRPPLKKKAQSREPSIFNDDNKSVKQHNNFESVDDLDIISVTPRMPKRNMTVNQKTQQDKKWNLDLTPSKQKPPFKGFQIQKTTQPQRAPIIQQKIVIQQKPVIQQKIIQKIIHIKQDNKQLSARYEQQIAALKQSYQRQIKDTQQKYQKLLEESELMRKNIMKTYEQNLKNQKKKWQNEIKTEGERIKSVYEWQSKIKTDGYELQIKKLKELLDKITKSEAEKNQQKLSKNNKNIQFELNLKMKEIEKQKQRLDDQKREYDFKKRQLESQEQQFQLYKRKEQNRLNEQRKKLYEYQTQIRKKQVQIKKQFLTQKQSLASELVQHQIILSQNKQNIRHQKQKLNLQKDLFNQQKMQYQKINNKILNDLKEKQKQIELEKEELNNLQIQCYKKINTIQLMASQKGLANNPNIKNPNLNLNNTLGRTSKQRNDGHRSISVYQQNHKQNYRSRANSELDNKISQTKNRYAQMQQMMRKNNTHKQSLNIDKGKIHLQKYIQKLSKDKGKYGNV